MIGDCELTIGRRTRISRYDAENANWSGSHHPAQPNVSLPSMPPHSTHSPINVICCADRISRSFAPVHSELGPGHPPPHDACCPLQSPRLNTNNVTKPDRKHRSQGCDDSALRCESRPDGIFGKDRPKSGGNSRGIRLARQSIKVVLSENHIRTYWWCSPARIGMAEIAPECWSARCKGASFCNAKCVRV